MELKVIKEKLNLNELHGFIKTVVDSVFVIDDEDGILKYVPENYDLFFKLAFASYYTDYESNDKNIEEIYNDIGFINFDTDIYPIDYNQLNIIKETINEKIDFLKQQLLNQSKKDSLSELLDSITSIVNNLNEKLKDVDTSNVNELINGFIKISGKMDNLSEKQIIDSVLKVINKTTKINKKNVM